jgi:hypothetical protein
VTTSESTSYSPTRSEARLIADSKNADIVMDRGDLASFLRTLASPEERRIRAERAVMRMGEDVSALRDMLEMLRLQVA